MKQGLMPGLLCAAFLAMATPASAELVIHATPGALGQPGDVIGGGDIEAIVNQAARYWEAVYTDPAQPWTLDITYSWSALDLGLAAQFVPTVIDATSNRILAGTVTFSNDDGVLWYADPNPEIMLGNPAFNSTPIITNESVDLPGGRTVDFNVGVAFEAAPDSLAQGRKDLLTIAMHEIGHGLGLLYRPDAPPNLPPFYDYVHPITVTPDINAFYAGLTIITDRSEHLNAPSLMADSTLEGFRFFPSANDILTMATISGYENPNLNPYDLPGIPVPEPGGFFLSLAALATLLFLHRRPPFSPLP